MAEDKRPWWRVKLEANVARDSKTTRALRAAGWKVLGFWEHEDFARTARKVAAAVRLRAGL